MGAFVTAMCLLVVVVLLLLPRPQAPAEAALGVYVGPAATDEVDAFEEWLGRDVAWVVDFVSDSRWTDIAYPQYWTEAWAATDRHVVYSLPLLPEEEGTLQEGAAGSYDHVFEDAARTLVEAGHGDAIVRLGWEFNIEVFPWSAAEDPAAFVAYWRRAVNVMRAQEGAAFRFDWTVNAGPGAMDAEDAYPGDAYVDIVGLDAYDYVSDREVVDPAERWHIVRTQPYGLDWHRDFAAARGKEMSFPEWGVWDRPDGGGGGDNPYYIERMHEWFNEHEPVYHAYFEHPGEPGDHRLRGGDFPDAADRFRELFGR